MKHIKNYLFKYICLSLLAIIIYILINNLVVNLIRTGIGFNFNWLMRPAGFAISEHSLPYSTSDNYAWALFIAWINSLKVIINSLILSTLLGVSIGIARISNNNFLKKSSALYIALIRQTPLLLQLLFWYFVGFLQLKNISFLNMISISNKEINLLGINLSPEFASLLIGLTVFTSAYIAEVVRGGLNSVPKGQWEAFKCLGINESIGLRKIIIPQAMPAILPGLTSQYLNLAKNSTLAIAIGYADIYAVGDTIINQTGRAIEGFIILLCSFLFINLIISNCMELINTLILKMNSNKY